jgi:hypothetical protein
VTAVRPRWTAGQVRAVGLTTDVGTAGEILGMGRTSAYDLAWRGDFPVTVIKVPRRRWVVPTAALLRLLGYEPEPVSPVDTADEHDLSVR